jgi:hypothetical protein
MACHILPATAAPLHFPLQLLILDNLDPVSIRIQNKSNTLHPSIGQSLLPLDAQSVESLTRGIQVVNRHADVAKALRFSIATVVFEVLVLFGAVVVCKFEDAFTIILVRGVGAVGIGEKVEVEFIVRVLHVADQLHAHDILVEFEGNVLVLDTDHRVVLDMLAMSYSKLYREAMPFYRCLCLWW